MQITPAELLEFVKTAAADKGIGSVSPDAEKFAQQAVDALKTVGQQQERGR